MGYRSLIIESCAFFVSDTSKRLGFRYRIVTPPTRNNFLKKIQEFKMLKRGDIGADTHGTCIIGHERVGSTDCRV